MINILPLALSGNISPLMRWPSTLCNSNERIFRFISVGEVQWHWGSTSISNIKDSLCCIIILESIIIKLEIQSGNFISKKYGCDKNAWNVLKISKRGDFLSICLFSLLIQSQGAKASKALLVGVTAQWSRGMVQDTPVSGEYYPLYNLYCHHCICATSQSSSHRAPVCQTTRVSELR